jgi:hypothetical protein
MPTDAKKDQPVKKGSRKADDLTAIKGIGDSLKQWLRDSFKVHTFADIAALSAEEVEARAKQDGRFLPFSRIQQIIAQARELSDDSLLPGLEIGKRASAKKENDWKEIATFIIYFERKVVRGREKKRTKAERRTAIHHYETGKLESWVGVDPGQACHWMKHQLSQQGELLLEELAKPAPSVARRSATRAAKTTTKTATKTATKASPRRAPQRKAKTPPRSTPPPAEGDWQALLPGGQTAPAQGSVEVAGEPINEEQRTRTLTIERVLALVVNEVIYEALRNHNISVDQARTETITVEIRTRTQTIEQAIARAINEVLRTRSFASEPALVEAVTTEVRTRKFALEQVINEAMAEVLRKHQASTGEVTALGVRPTPPPVATQATAPQAAQPVSPEQLQEILELSQSVSSQSRGSQVVAAAPAAVAPIAAPAPVETSSQEGVALEVTEVQVVQPSATEQPQDLFVDNRAYTGYVKGGEPLAFTVKFRLTGAGAAEIVKRNSPFNVVFNAEEFFTSQITRLGESNPDYLRDGQFTYTTWLPPLSIAPGVYNLRVVTSVRDVQPVWSATDIPVLQVLE